ncbi:DUF3558 family protein [Streptomyces antimycoticus]|uniref:DUF3558 family protein n=1 Tax=Streptomyces antimycoticus TaxID=68175 RepID=UPI00386C20DF|nr:DUF3558 domain-containing protein [Streptomyces antimycoticus]
MAIVLAGAAACGGSSGSSPKSSGSTTSATGSADESDSTTATLKGLDYCSLLGPAALTAAGIHDSKGQLPADYPNVLGCWWMQDKTIVNLTVSVGAQVNDLDKGEKQDFSGFEGASQYNEITSECFVDVNVGLDQFRVDIVDPSGENKALTGKKCNVGVQLARQVVAKIKK